MLKQATPPLTTNSVTAATSATLQTLQRQRTWYMKSRIMVANRLRATIAGSMGYQANLPEKERAKLFKDADAKIARISKGEESSELAGLVLTTQAAVGGFQDMQDGIEKEMLRLAKTLPVAAWVNRPAQRGFGLLSLAIVVGECGDLSNYANPGKLWKRLGCAPFEKDGITAMGATWRSGKVGKLHAEEWEAFGYSPRRRSIAYLFGEGIVKQNQGGPYRARYDEAKVTFKVKHPEASAGHCHNHAMLVATKRLLRDLWVEWNGAAEVEL